MSEVCNKDNNASGLFGQLTKPH